jgi:very-short-patch-repair endonuclease
LARRLRKAMTPAEKALWAALRRVAPEEAHFRKQAPLGPFITDFISHAARLVVELEGGAHLAPDVALADVERRAWIEGRGYRVLRFSNEDVLASADVVAQRIAAEARLRLSRPS